MITSDLKLLIDVAWANRDGQVEFPLAKGEHAAAERLVKRDLLMNCGSGRVGITNEGERVVGIFSEKVRRSRSRAVK